MSAAEPARGATYRAGRFPDLYATFRLSELAMHQTAQSMGLVARAPLSEQRIEREWELRRPLLEFMAAQLEGEWWVCERDGEPIGHGRVCRFGAMEQLTELMVLPGEHGRGLGRALLERLWPGDPTPDLGRVVIAAGAPADLSLYAGFGAMPTTGHWHLRATSPEYAVRRAREIDANDPSVHVLEPARAVAEWQRLEPPAIAHRRPLLHEFFGRTRSCLATMSPDATQAIALCWVGPDGEIGPAVSRTPEELVPVVLQALDRVAKTLEPESLALYCSTDAWWLLRRLRRLGFRVWWPSWVMSSIPLPGLDRYLPGRPPYLL